MAGKRQADNQPWLDLEVRGSEFQDTRLRRRFAILPEKLWDGMGQNIPLACQDWASTKAAYRFLYNDRVSEHDTPSGHFQASAERVKAPMGRCLSCRTQPHSHTNGSATNSRAPRARRLSYRSNREARLVRDALENRVLPQNPEIGLQNGRILAS
jgi:hypothetical protein